MYNDEYMYLIGFTHIRWISFKWKIKKVHEKVIYFIEEFPYLYLVMHWESKVEAIFKSLSEER